MTSEGRLHAGWAGDHGGVARHRRKRVRRARLAGTAALTLGVVGAVALAGVRWGPPAGLLDAAAVTRVPSPSPALGSPALRSSALPSSIDDPPTVPVPSPTPPRPSPPAAPPTPLTVTTLALDSSGPAVREAEARLHQLGLVPLRLVDGSYGTTTRDAVARFQRANRLAASGSVDAATWTALRTRTRTPTKAELLGVQLDARCLTGRVLCIDKTARRLAWVVDGSLQRVLDVRFGSEYTPTREGTFTVFWRHIDHVSTLYGSPMPYSMFFSRGQAVHYSSDFAARGYAGASHGCVNVRDRAGIRALYAEVRVGDSVVVYVS
jgi:lipoprotein-anchoring transpeptidase ErfK/SrfK